MPPRIAKRGAASAGSKRMPRSTRGASKSQNPPAEPVEEAVRVEDASVPVVMAREEEEEEVVEDVKSDGKPIGVVLDENAGLNLNFNGLVAMKKDNDLKESIEEYEKDERLELDDNEPEYETEEYGGVDYDEKEMDADEVGDELEEEPEGDLSDEEDVHEVEVEVEVEGDDDDEHAGDKVEHADLADAAEHEERHEVVQERRKRKEFEVFVGGLDKDATEDDIRKVFSQVGEVVEVRLMMNLQTKKNKGFAFLRFATIEQAKRAFTELKNPVINGKQCGVTPSQDSDTLFLGNICRTWTKEALKEKLKHYGVDNVDDLTLVEDSNNEGMNRGFAFLEFASRSDAMDAFKRLQRRDVLFGVDRPAKVSFADSFIDPGDEIMAQVRTIFIDCLPPSWDEDRVRELLKKYGEIEKIELARNMPSADRKDYGFVTFDTHDAAVTCAKSINNTELGEGNNKAKVRARLSRPHQRGRGKHIGRDSFRSGRGSGRFVRGSWGHQASHDFHPRGIRGISSRVPPPSLKRPVGLRDRRPIMSATARGRPLAPPPSRSYDRRAPVATYPKNSLKREYSRRDELPPPRSRAVVDYGSRFVPERRPSYGDEYSSRNSGYSDLPRSTSRPAARRPYVDDAYVQRFERPPPSYREGRGRDYASMSGSKRPYSAMDDIPPRYADVSARHSRAHVEYELAGGAPPYVDAYGDRLGRSSLGYGGSRSSMSSSQDSHGLYGSRQGMGYGGGSFSSSDVGEMYSSSGYGGDYMPRGSDVGGSSYSSMYSSRGMGGSSYMGGGGSGSYY
ncbi:nucleolin-like [Durio zibethinus]|uniref:Nucleolin-like n=1 Tax=Durio zibethinus TaxID=66656 RepID=A0A6P6AZD1_DURZI|nr:nucleolin-like [Durio zibethinus]XP_022770150.1 nucleolin-like [Durio zibethinus]